MRGKSHCRSLLCSSTASQHRPTSRYTRVSHLSAQKGWVPGARRWGDDAALSRCPERRPTDPASVCARNVRNPALLRA